MWDILEERKTKKKKNIKKKRKHTKHQERERDALPLTHQTRTATWCLRGSMLAHRGVGKVIYPGRVEIHRPRRLSRGGEERCFPQATFRAHSPSMTLCNNWVSVWSGLRGPFPIRAGMLGSREIDAALQRNSSVSAYSSCLCTTTHPHRLLTALGIWCE